MANTSNAIPTPEGAAAPSVPLHLKKARLTTEEASQYLEAVHGVRLAKITLTIKRCKGGGPAFQKFGHRVLYTPAALDEWALAKLGAPVRSTSEIQASTA